MSDAQQINEGLATLEVIKNVIHHPNADKLDIVRVLGYDAIVGRDQYKAGELVIFVQPDSILPSDKAWAQDLLRYTSRGRIRAVRLRGEWSMGLVLPLTTGTDDCWEGDVGDDVTQDLGITKYEPALPKNTAAHGGLPFLIPKTDENRWQNLRDLDNIFGQSVDIFQKVDGSSFTAYCVLPEHNPNGLTVTGLCSRSLELKVGIDDRGQEYNSKWHEAERRYNVLEKLSEYCAKHNVSLALRGEIYGQGIQQMAHNPHANGDVDVAFFSVYNIGAKKYERKGSEHYFLDVCKELGLPTVMAVELDAVLDEDVISWYDKGTKTLDDKPFEGVVVQHPAGSFKIINKWYDAEKE